MHLKRLLLYWLPPLAWMVVIFAFSSRHRLVVTHSPVYDFVIFKFLHMLEYAILYFLLFRAFYSLSSQVSRKAAATSFLIAVLYAASDEIHQTFVPTREGKLRDVFIDTLGITLMYIYIKRRFKSSFYPESRANARAKDLDNHI